MSFYSQSVSNNTGSSGGVTSVNGLTGALTLAAGSGITLTPSGNTITIAASGGSGANTALSNLDATTAINSSLTFDNAADKSILIPASSSGNGKSLTLRAGLGGAGSTSGGSLTLSAGTGGFTDGNVNVTGVDFALLGSSTSASPTTLKFFQYGTNNYVGLTVGTVPGTPPTFTLPGVLGSTGDSMITSGSGTLSFAARANTTLSNLSGFTATRVPFFSSSTAITESANLTFDSTNTILSVGGVGGQSGAPAASPTTRTGAIYIVNPNTALSNYGFFSENSSSTVNTGGIFSGRRSHGTATLGPAGMPQTNDVLAQFSGSGWDGADWSTMAAGMRVTAITTWSTTNHNAEARLYATAPSSTALKIAAAFSTDSANGGGISLVNFAQTAGLVMRYNGAGYNLQMPASQGAASTLLSNNGSGLLSWVATPVGLSSEWSSSNAYVSAYGTMPGIYGTDPSNNHGLFAGDVPTGNTTTTPGSLTISASSIIETTSTHAAGTVNISGGRTFGTGQGGGINILPGRSRTSYSGPCSFGGTISHLGVSTASSEAAFATTILGQEASTLIGGTAAIFSGPGDADNGGDVKIYGTGSYDSTKGSGNIILKTIGGQTPDAFEEQFWGTSDTSQTTSGDIRLIVEAAATTNGNIQFRPADGSGATATGKVWTGTDANGSGTWTNLGVTAYPVTHTDLDSGSMTNSITLFSLPAATILDKVVIKHSASFDIAGYTLSVGVAGNDTKYASAFDVFQSPGATVFQLSNSANIEDFVSPINITITATASAALNTASTGSATIYVITKPLN